MTKRTRTPSKRFPGVYSYDGASGRMWGATVELEPDWRTGKRITKRKQGFRTQDEAKDWRIAEQDKRRRGDTLEPSLTPFGVYVDEWLAGQTMRPKSILTYQNRLAHVVRGIGHVPLSHVTTTMLDRVLRELTTAGLSDNYVREIHSSAKAVLQRAVDHRMIPANPALLVRPPKRQATEHVTWTGDQMRAFLAVRDDPFWDLVFRFMAETWVRVGELIDLRWDAVDLAMPAVRIERTVTLDANRHRISSPPKSAAGRRTIPISSDLADWLRRHKDQQRFRGGHDLVFPAPRSDRWLQQPSVAYALARYCEQADAPLVTPHGLRHIGGSLAYAAGVPLKIISERMGHSNATITINVYTHVDGQQHRDAAAAISEILAPRSADVTHGETGT